MTRRSTALTLLVLFAAPFVAGCGSIIHGTRQEIILNSTPEGAQILENGQPIGTTPTTLRFRRGDDHLLTFRLDGYQDVRVTLNKELSPVTLLNLIGGGLIGFVVDFSNGAAYELDPDIVDVVMQREGMSAVEAREGEVNVVFFTTDQVAEAMAAQAAAE